MKLLNFGSLNIDYVYSLDHLVTPGETISSKGLEIYCGGKGLNQSVALAKAGAKVYHAGKIGSDGDILLETLKSVGVNVDFVLIDNLQSGHAMIQVDDLGQNSIILYKGANHRITESEIDGVLQEFEAGDILLLQNEINNISYIMRQAHRRGMRIFINPAPMNDEVLDYPLELVSCFIVNEIESYQLTDEKVPELAAEKIIERYPNACCLVTLGSEGAIYKDSVQSFFQPVFKTQVVDTTSAGDTFTGYFIACIINSMTPNIACRTAAMASSICVSRKGAAVSVPYADEVLGKLTMESAE